MPQGSYPTLDLLQRASAGPVIAEPLFVFDEARAARGAVYGQAYRELCEVVTGRAPSPTPIEESEFARLALDYLRDHHPELRDAIRAELAGENGEAVQDCWAVPVSLVISLAEYLIASTGAGGAAAAAWLCLSGAIAEFCQGATTEPAPSATRSRGANS